MLDSELEPLMLERLKAQFLHIWESRETHGYASIGCLCLESAYGRCRGVMASTFRLMHEA